jgi:DNA-binding MarR family transcriptional regulator
VDGLLAKRDRSFDPVRMHPGFEREFPAGEASASEVVLNLTLAGTIAINRVEELLTQYGLVLKAFNVLAVLTGAGEALTPTTISQRTFVGKTTVTSVMDALERRRLLSRRQHPSNRRSVLVEVTDDGRSMCQDILVRLHELEATWVAELSERDRQTLIRLLGQTKGLLSRARIPPRSPRPKREGAS